MATESFGFGRPGLEQMESLRLRPGQEGRPEHLGPRNDTYFGKDHVTDWVYGQGGDDFLQGAGGKDLLYGGSGHDTISGGKARDFISGDRGDDTLYGNGGHDVLDGGAGTDSIDGGEDGKSDRIVFSRASDSLPGTAHDTVYRFEASLDRLDLRLIDADSSTSTNDAFSWIGDAAFSGVAGELRINANLLQGDVDGDGVADFEVRFIDGSLPQQSDILF